MLLISDLFQVPDKKAEIRATAVCNGGVAKNSSLLLAAPEMKARKKSLLIHIFGVQGRSKSHILVQIESS